MKKLSIHLLLSLASTATLAQCLENVSSEVGIAHNSVLVSDVYGAMGGGAAWFDHDNDGFLDLYLTGFEGPDKLYRNLGDGSFDDISLESGIENITSGIKTTAIVTGDTDNDGDRDLFISTGPDSPNLLLLHNPDHTYTDVSNSSGIIEIASSYSAAMGDYDLDGLLDIYVTNWLQEWDNDGNSELVHSAYHDILYHNNGDGTFTNVASQFGMNDSIGCGLAVAFTDVDMDHDQDLFVVNDFGHLGNSENRVWINMNPNMSFTDNSPVMGLNAGLHGMGIAIGDINDDGQFDYYATNLGANVYHRSTPSGEYDEVAETTGIDDPLEGNIVSTGWGCTFLDVDNDTDLDLAVSNGSLILGSAAPNPSRLFLNDGSGQFSNLENACGIGDSLTNRGVAKADYDNDGDVDLILVRIDTSSLAHSILYENTDGNMNNWLQVSVQGVHNNRDGYGAKVYVQFAGRTLIREIHGGSSYCSQHSSLAHFGLGANTAIDSLWVIWPGGYSQPVEIPGINQRVHVVEDGLVGTVFQKPLPISLSQPLDNVLELRSSKPLEVVELWTVSGQLLMRLPGNHRLQQQFEIGKISAGVYLVRATFVGGHVLSRRFLKRP